MMMLTHIIFLAGTFVQVSHGQDNLINVKGKMFAFFTYSFSFCGSRQQVIFLGAARDGVYTTHLGCQDFPGTVHLRPGFCVCKKRRTITGPYF